MQHPRYEKFQNDSVFNRVTQAMVNLMLTTKLTDTDMQDCLDVAREIVERERFLKETKRL